MALFTKRRSGWSAPLRLSALLATGLLGSCNPDGSSGVQGAERSEVSDGGSDQRTAPPPDTESSPPTLAAAEILKTIDAYLEWSDASRGRDEASAGVDDWVGRLGGAADLEPGSPEGLAARVHLVALLNVNRRYAESIPQVDFLVAYVLTEPERLYWLAELAEIRFLAGGRGSSAATRGVTLESIDLALHDLAGFLSESAERCARYPRLLERHGRLAMYGCELARSARDPGLARSYLERGRALGEIVEGFGQGDARRPSALFEEELLVELTADTAQSAPGELLERLERIARKPRADEERFRYLGDRVLRALLTIEGADPLPSMNRVAALGVEPTLLTLERARGRCAFLLAEQRHAEVVQVVEWCVGHVDVEGPRTQGTLAQLAVVLGAAGVASEDEALIRRAIDLLLATAGAEIGDDEGALQAFQRALDEAKGS